MNRGPFKLGMPSNTYKKDYTYNFQIFWDLTSQYKDSSGDLHIFDDEVLGKGGFGFVCKGEIASDVRNGCVNITLCNICFQYCYSE